MADSEDPNLFVKDQSSTKVGVTDACLLPSEARRSKCCHKAGGRNLIVSIDGTANQFGEKNTNVIELYNLILKEVGDNQRTWYNSGIGTYARPSWKSLSFYKQVVYHKIDLAIAWNFEQTLLAAYRWLSDTYEPGDCIFLFGFSRGAFQVRVLSAMIDKVGLIHKGNEMQIPFAFQLYADPKSDDLTASRVGSADTQRKLSSADRFKQTFSYKDVKVHFVGAWDTVSSIGIVRGSHMFPRTIDGMKHVCYFRHALALDERRVKFLPEYANGGSGPPPPAKSEEMGCSPIDQSAMEETKHSPTFNEEGTSFEDTAASNAAPARDFGVVGGSQIEEKSTEAPPQTLEVWFAGTHSDIGGGNAENAAMDRSRPPLRWMVFEAGALGLRTALFERVLPPDEQIEIIESLTPGWWPLELVFFKRLTYTRNEHGKKSTHKPHLGSARKIHAGQKIHGSLTLSGKLGTEYTPKARPLDDDPAFWKRAQKEGLGEWQAVDLYMFTETLVKKFAEKNDTTVWQTLRQTAKSGDGRQAVYEGVIKALKSSKAGAEIKYQLIAKIVDILENSMELDSSVKLSRSADIRASVQDLLKSDRDDYKEVAVKFVEQFTDHCMLVLDGHTDLVTSVAFSPDGGQVVSGSGDRTVRIWDTDTGKPVAKPFVGHAGSVTSVGFSAGRGRVSSSDDESIRTWDVQTGREVGNPSQGYTGNFTATAFSPEGKHVVSGSRNRTVRVWNIETGRPITEPLRGHTGLILSVAFSPDGKRIVSGSGDHTIRIWDVESGQSVGEPLLGHTGWIRSLAFSPDGKRIVSGSSDKTIRLWDLETGKEVREPFCGHTDLVLAVAFSPDGRRIVSGSGDNTIRIWDLEIGKPARAPFRSHAGWVRSVAFSPDGKRVVSGSGDKSIRIWDADQL
ncbi:hypothetical protein GALMADRAFT_139557 [Galerina marginata CBS 339.88]|uniref:T6SS Phospholipase effector Tle1-like catalytic domain-containing protein n=1 Tax=Galerina marginata (strain CBS 339.88) TaxID=685588 RepID=A0A067T0C7_GALM3|nr:hypothetical protein GALMADRAFT_139557 [Galerina marginata CBS 339.88]